MANLCDRKIAEIGVNEDATGGHLPYSPSSLGKIAETTADTAELLFRE